MARQDSDRVAPQIHSSHFPLIPQEAWRDAADVLRRNRLGALASLCLEVFAPLAPIAAQVLHAAGPLFDPRAAAFARVLESDRAVSDMAHYLNEDPDPRDMTPEVPRD